MESPGDGVVRKGPLRRGQVSRDLTEARAAEGALALTGNGREGPDASSRKGRGPGWEWWMGLES